MVQILPSQLSLQDVEERFKLQPIWNDPSFFLEWQLDWTELTDFERELLDQVKTASLIQAKQALHEEVVKITVLSPLLLLAGLLQPPFQLEAKKQVEILVDSDSEDEIIRGRIDCLILHQQLWAIVIESKRKQLNVLEALPQALCYMMASPPNQLQPIYGLILNGTEFLFLKLIKQNSPQYGLSKLFSIINPGNDLYDVLKILKKLREIALVS